MKCERWAKARSGAARVLRSCLPAQYALEGHWSPDTLRSPNPTALQPPSVRQRPRSPVAVRREPAEFLVDAPASHSVPLKPPPKLAASRRSCPPGLETPSLTFLVALRFGHRAGGTCSGRRCCLLGPRRRGGLWDGRRELPSRVPDPIRAAARLSLPGRLQDDFPRAREPPSPEGPGEGFA